MPEQSQQIGESGKQVSDLIEPTASISWTGTKGEAGGDVKYVDDLSDLFGLAEKDGHFFPVKFDAKYQGEQIELSGREGGNRTVTVDSDLLLVVRIENLAEGKTLTAKADGEEIFSVDFSKATLAQNPTMIRTRRAR